MFTSIWVNCPVRPQLHIPFTLNYNFQTKKKNQKQKQTKNNRKKRKKHKTLLNDSQPEYVLGMFVKFWLISAWMFLFKKVPIK